MEGGRVSDITPQPLDADFYFDADNVRLFPAPSKDTLDYIQALTGSADTPVTFQTFDDSDEKRGSLAKVIHGPVWECFGRLRELNLAGAGVFVTVNQTDGIGRKAENVKRVRSLFVDFDETSASPNLEPSFRVESDLPGESCTNWSERGRGKKGRRRWGSGGTSPSRL
jgi:hypothetical protein